MAKTTSKSKQGYYSAYKASSKWKTNRERRLQKLIKQNPGNKEQLELAIKNLVYRRKTPGTTGSWSKTNIHVAKLFKLFAGRVDKDIFSSNPKVQAAALMLRGNTQFKEHKGKVDFTFKARAHDKYGNLVWG